MKVVHVISGLDIGGAEIFLEQLIAFWPKQHDTHEVIALHGGVIADRLRSKNIKVHEIRSQKSWGLISIKNSIWQVSALLDELKPDVVISALWSANMMAQLLCSAKKIPLVSILHNKSSFLSPLKRFLDVMSLVFFAHTRVAVSAGVAESYATFPLLGSLAEKPIVIENGIDIENLSARVAECRAAKNDIPKKFCFGAVGRFIPEKQFLLLIKAFGFLVRKLLAEGLPRHELPFLCIVGNGQEFERARSLVRSLSLQDLVILPGQRAEMAPFYADFSAYVSVSTTEGLSLALLEALGAGLPVIVSEQSGALAFLPTPGDGFAVNVATEKTIADGLRTMWDASAHYATRCAERINFVREHHSITKTALAYANLVDDVLASKP